MAGIGLNKFYERAASRDSEFELACKAIINAAEDAGIAVKDIDGLTTFAGANWDSDLMAHVLGMREMRFANNAWTGGGGVTSAVCNAALAVTSGIAECVVALKSLQMVNRFGHANTNADISGASRHPVPYLALPPR